MRFCPQSRYYPTVPVAPSARSRERQIKVGHYARGMHALGIDIGGTGIKAAPVDVAAGKLLAERRKIPTPRPALPDAVADVVKQLDHLVQLVRPGRYHLPRRGHRWRDQDGRQSRTRPGSGSTRATLFGEATGNPVRVLNDADAAGVAEMTFGAGVGEKGTVLMLTFGTGIGSALFTKGVLVPNTEFGHIEIRRSRRRDARVRARQGAARPELGQMGRPRGGLPPARGGAVSRRTCSSSAAASARSRTSGCRG